MSKAQQQQNGSVYRQTQEKTSSYPETLIVPTLAFNNMRTIKLKFSINHNLICFVKHTVLVSLKNIF